MLLLWITFNDSLLHKGESPRSVTGHISPFAILPQYTQDRITLLKCYPMILQMYSLPLHPSPQPGSEGSTHSLSGGRAAAAWNKTVAKFLLGFCVPEALDLGDWRGNILLKFHKPTFYPFRLKITFHILRRDAVENWCELSSSKPLFFSLYLEHLLHNFSLGKDSSSINQINMTSSQGAHPEQSDSQNIIVKDTWFHLLS